MLPAAGLRDALTSFIDGGFAGSDGQALIEGLVGALPGVFAASLDSVPGSICD